MVQFCSAPPVHFLSALDNWQPPEGVEIKAMYARPDGGGFAISEADTASHLMEAIAPFLTFNDYEVVPIVEIEEAAQIMGRAQAWRDSIG